MNKETIEKSASWVQDYATIQEIWRLMLWKKKVAEVVLHGNVEESRLAMLEFGIVCEQIKKLIGVE